MMNRCLLGRRAFLIVAAGALQPLFTEGASAGDLFHHGTSYRSTVVTNAPGHSIMLAPATSVTGLQYAPVATHQMMLSPVSTMQFSSSSLQLVPATTGQTVHLAPSAASSLSLQLAPSSGSYQSLQLAPSTLNLGSQTQYVVSSPSSTGLMLAPANVAGQTLSRGTTGSSDLDTAYHVLTLGFGNQRSKLDAFETAIKKKLGDLINAGGSALSNPDVTSVLVSIAKDFLKTPESGFAGLIVNDALEPFLSTVISNIVQKQKAGKGEDVAPPPANPNAPNTPNAPTPSTVPQGAMSFDVSGRIVLTPSGSGPASNSAPSNGNQTNGNGQTNPPPPPPPTNMKTDPGAAAAPEIP